jgi:hypothetical protein
MTPLQIFIQTRRPSLDGEDTGVVEEGWYIVENNFVHMTDKDANKLRGEFSRRPTHCPA